jgi:penicillin-binding protein 1A
VLQTFEPQVRNQIDVLDTEEWNAIHSGMRMVVENTKEFDGFPIEAAGKTGTTNEAKDLVFAGFTPYYTAAIWATYDTHAEFPESDREFHKRLWAKVMNEIHEGLADMDFETSATVQEATICTKTGLLARSSCPSITEYFAVSDLPTERCKGHYTAPASTPTPTRTPSAASTPQATPTPTEAPQETPAPTETPADPPSNTPETPDTPDTPDAPSEPDTPAEISEVQLQSEESGSSE